jgi:membrane-associated phospholipid phosphatase
MLVAGIVLLACAAAFAGVMRADLAHPPVAGLDHDWLSLVAGTRTGALTDLFKALSLVGGPVGATIIVAVLCVLLLVVGRWRTALYIALAEASGSACSQLVKHAVLRHRPPHPLVTADLGSFPSGHVITTLGVGLALTVAFTRPGHRRYPLAVVAAATALMMFGRTYLAAHWLTDTVESLPLAAGLGLILWWTFDPLLDHDRDRPLRPARMAGATAGGTGRRSGGRRRFPRTGRGRSRP